MHSTNPAATDSGKTDKEDSEMNLELLREPSCERAISSQLNQTGKSKAGVTWRLLLPLVLMCCTVSCTNHIVTREHVEGPSTERVQIVEALAHRQCAITCIELFSVVVLRKNGQTEEIDGPELYMNAAYKNGATAELTFTETVLNMYRTRPDGTEELVRNQGRWRKYSSLKILQTPAVERNGGNQ